MKNVIILIALMFYGFQWYAGALQAWPRMLIVPRIFTLIGVAFFGAVDIFWNITIGSLIYLELPFLHGVTFSQRTEYWFNQSNNDWRKTYLLGANNWAALLNSISIDHIKKWT